MKPGRKPPDTLRDLRNVTAGASVDLAASVDLQAGALASTMKAIHGGEWRARVDHQREVVLIRRC